jgi:hypothetical protein
MADRCETEAGAARYSAVEAIEHCETREQAASAEVYAHLCECYADALDALALEYRGLGGTIAAYGSPAQWTPVGLELARRVRGEQE